MTQKTGSSFFITDRDISTETMKTLKKNLNTYSARTWSSQLQLHKCRLTEWWRQIKLITDYSLLPSVLWHCWLGVRKSIRHIKIEWWGVGVVICVEQGADCLHMVQLVPLPSQNPTVSCLVQIQTGFTFPVLAYRGCPGKQAIKRV